jgi:hypothetical protein
MNLRPATLLDLDALVRRHVIGTGVCNVGGRLVLDHSIQGQGDLGSWKTGDWWPRIKALAPISWYVDEMIAQGH